MKRQTGKQDFFPPLRLFSSVESWICDLRRLDQSSWWLCCYQTTGTMERNSKSRCSIGWMKNVPRGERHALLAGWCFSLSVKLLLVEATALEGNTTPAWKWRQHSNNQTEEKNGDWRTAVGTFIFFQLKWTGQKKDALFKHVTHQILDRETVNKVMGGMLDATHALTIQT